MELAELSRIDRTIEIKAPRNVYGEPSPTPPNSRHGFK
jgi:hypothetical protein